MIGVIGVKSMATRSDTRAPGDCRTLCELQPLGGLVHAPDGVGAAVDMVGASVVRGQSSVAARVDSDS